MVIRLAYAINSDNSHKFRKYMDELGVAHMAWGPLAEGKNGFFTNETLIKIGEKYGKTGPQVALRYLMELGIIIMPSHHDPEIVKWFMSLLPKR